MPFKMSIIAPDRTVFEIDDAEYVVLNGREGEAAIEDDAAPMLLALAPGRCEVRHGRDGESRQVLVISGGFARVGLHGVTVLADSAEKLEDVDAERAGAAKERAEKRLDEEHDERIDVARAEASLGRAMARLKAAAEHDGDLE